MDSFKRKLMELQSSCKTDKLVEMDDLKRKGLSDITLRPYQLEGVNWILQRYHNNHGCILGDEMGLGKTCQTIASLLYIHGEQSDNLPFLIISPLTVMGNWQDELSRFAPKLKVIIYHGDKEKRHEMQASISRSRKSGAPSFDVLLTTYEIVMKDEENLRPIEWGEIVVDEAHRLKNSESLLHVTLSEFSTRHIILLTGTPVQNNLDELYSLLNFVAPKIFRNKYRSDFIEEYQSKVAIDADVSELHDTLKPFLLRRIKTDVVRDLPMKSELVFYHGLSDLQKKYYKAILLKDSEIFENPETGSRASLMNIMMQLRKCVNHPYLFDGMEPEPFELGEHLIEASGKLVLIDTLLHHLYSTGHKVLMFSQMTHMLDILQDYLGYRGYNYERLDGSVRGEERFVAVRNFNRDDDTFIFLLSTKAGGQGLNLTSADTVIFVDSDFNPQNDLQAAARAHRIGQTRPVKIVRLIGRSTVEEIILKRAEEKLRLTSSVIEGGQLAGNKAALIASNNKQLKEILKFGLSELMDDEKRETIDYIGMLGSTVDGVWQVEEGKDVKSSDIPQTSKEAKDDSTSSIVPESMYVFEGTDYKTKMAADDDAFSQLMAERLEEIHQDVGEGRPSRRSGATNLTELFPFEQQKPRRKLTPEEAAERQKKRAETIARKQREAELEEVAKQERKNKRRQELWKRHNYISSKLIYTSDGESNGSDDEEDIEDQEDEEEDGGRKINYISGDVTKPTLDDGGSAFIVHCADDSGSWGYGGVFSAIDNISPQPKAYYENASHMKDLSLGDIHLIPLTSTLHLALIIAQHRSKNGSLSGIKLSALAQGLQCIYRAAKTQKASVHLPRIGYNTPQFNWYGTERLVRKHLSSRGVPTHIYYYPRRNKRPRDDGDSPSNTKAKKNNNDDNVPSTSKSSTSSHLLPDVFKGMNIYLHGIPDDIAKDYRRFIIAYDGDLDDEVTDCTTHIVSSLPRSDHDRQEMKDLIGQRTYISVVSTQWLETCIRKQKTVDTKRYEISLT